MNRLQIKSKSDCRWDFVGLGEVLLRFDPGDERISAARRFLVFEGGGEYNVARNLRRAFGCQTAIVTALADNQIGRLVEDLILNGSVDASQILWRAADSTGAHAQRRLFYRTRFRRARARRVFRPRQHRRFADRAGRN